MLSKYKHYIALHIIIVIFGFTGILGKLIHLEAEVIVWHRVLIAAVSLGLIMLLFGYTFKVSSKKRLLQICAIGVIVGLHWITFFKAIQLSTASFGVLCLSTTTIHVAWLEPIVMRRPFSWMEMLLSLVVIYGIYFVSDDFTGKELQALGYGLASALFAGIFSVFNAKFAQDTKPSTISFYEMCMATLSITILLFFNGQLDASIFSMRIQDFLWLLFLGVVCTSFAFLATIEIVKYLGAFTVSLSINLEPVYAIILGAVILQENELLDSRFYIGASLIILVVIFNGILKGIINKRSKNSL